MARASIVIIACASLFGCKKEAAEEKWVTSPGLTVTAMKTEENGKPYINIIYENFGADTVRKIKYQLFQHKGSKWDTTEKIIDLPSVLKPKDRHLVPRAIGEEPTTADEIGTGKVWVIKN